MLNVIDNPGLFNSSVDNEFVGKEIVKCIKMAREGIHVVLVVLAARNSFSKQEEGVISSLRTLFGNKINDYMIVVFTGGDELEHNEQTFEDFLEDCPVPLKRGAARLHEDTEQVQALKRYIKQEVSDQMDKSFEEQLQRFTEMAKSRLKEFAERWIAREKAGNDEICKLRERLERIKAPTDTTIGKYISNNEIN